MGQAISPVCSGSDPWSRHNWMCTGRGSGSHHNQVNRTPPWTNSTESFQNKRAVVPLHLLHTASNTILGRRTANVFAKQKSDLLIFDLKQMEWTHKMASTPSPCLHVITSHFTHFNNLLHNSTMYCCCIPPTGLWPTLGCEVKLVRCTKLPWVTKRLPVTYKYSRYYQWVTGSTHVFEYANRERMLNQEVEEEHKRKERIINENYTDRKERRKVWQKWRDDML